MSRVDVQIAPGAGALSPQHNPHNLSLKARLLGVFTRSILRQHSKKEPIGDKSATGKRMSAPVDAPSRQVSTPIKAPAASLGAMSLASSTSVNSDVSISLGSSVASSTSPQPQVNKRSANDFIFGKSIGEGSFASVFLAKDIHTQNEFAIKTVDKRHVLRENKAEYIKREKEALTIVGCKPKATAPFFVKLYCTFQDEDRLFFAITYARKGELLHYMNREGLFDIDCTRFYSAEILQALGHLHSIGIIHRDLKPENILLSENMHILITDFGSAKILNTNNEPGNNRASRRKNSFVGTAQYVSPELLTDKMACPASDLWALGCIIYQMISGITPFHDPGHSEYFIFKKIVKLKYIFPDGFCANAKDLVEKLLVLDSKKRLGATDGVDYLAIKSHPFYKGLDFDTLYRQKPPLLNDDDESEASFVFTDDLEPGLDERQLSRLLGLSMQDTTASLQDTTASLNIATEAPVQERPRSKNAFVVNLTEEEIKQKLESQKENSKWHTFVSGKLILKQGLVDKRKGLFARRRMLLLTMGPHLFYVDPTNMVLKGEIPWSPTLRAVARNFKVFMIHTPNRIYYLEDPEGYALEWCKAIMEVKKHTYGEQEEDS